MARTKTKPTGRPKGSTRGRHAADVSTVRVDDETKATLRHEFGSLGNALYFVAQGIVAFRRKHGLTPGGDAELRSDPHAELTYGDLVTLREALWHHVDAWRGDDKAVAPFVAVIRKLEAMLYGSETYYGDLPPVGPRQAERKRKKKRRTRYIGVSSFWVRKKPAAPPTPPAQGQPAADQTRDTVESVDTATLSNL